MAGRRLLRAPDRSLLPLVVLIGAITGGSRHGFELGLAADLAHGPLGVLDPGRHVGAPAAGGLIAALGIAFSGYYTGNAEHTSMIAVLSFLPGSSGAWTWRSRHDVRAGDRGRRLVATLRARGYSGLVLLNACFVGLWSLARAPLRRVIVAHILLLIVGLVVLLANLRRLLCGSPWLDFTPCRRAPTTGRCESNALHPRALFTAIRPELALRDVYEVHGHFRCAASTLARSFRSSRCSRS